MKLGQWHHRRGGKWKVRAIINPHMLDGYEWFVEFNNRTLSGYEPVAWLARRRAIAALKRLAAGNSPQ